MKAWIASILLAAFCTLVTPALAQTPAPGVDQTQPVAPEPAPEHLNTARELLKIANVEGVMRGAMANQAELIEQQIKRIAPNTDPQVVALVERITHEETEKNIPRILDESARIYARHFSEKDLRGLIAFYQTPLGSKLIGQLPQVTREITQLSAELASNMMVRVVEELKKQKAAGQTP